ncbi:PhnD/SsuA/transferrin family substrate-binding protein [Hyalangium rubrum]|uniref:PhnD/SsuA/transferrin family substrate-binding protein n=1 Tax=Hyalangium rubrum TaxID=3103134 RepID=A0ABU5H823_9BACT|nr:PhnD/SsuA/transferrin family substrate-binding protein [Hyalangium sp. s54d21]MDY7229624.1 PhnD/SsuA/transferrin family substrate-binding protein [Hyalangium sp. s54d21]
MKTSRLLLICLAMVCAWAPAAWAQKKSTLGVFLPTTLTDGQERFEFAEKLAGQLGTALGQPVAAKSFGRYEDFSKAISDGLVDFAVVDAWAAVQLGAKATPVAFAALSGDTNQRWAIVSNAKGSVKDLAGKRLALTKGSGPSDPKFVSHVVFAGDLDAQRHFKIVSVPNVESALKALEAKGAEAALVPVSHVPKDMKVLFRSAKVPGAVLVSLRGNPESLENNLSQLSSVAPFSAFVKVQGREFEDFRKLAQQGPPRRQPVIIDSPVLRVDTDALVQSEQLNPVLPSFTSAMEVSGEQPDD